jgi:hypothetical protein
MKTLISIFMLLALSLTACGQTDQTFNKPVYLNAGFYVGGVFYNSIPSGGAVNWNDILNKPATFPPSAHNHDLLYKPIGYVPSWTEITGKPQETALIDALPLLAYLPLPQKTTAEINALSVPAGVIAMIWDKTLGVLKVWDGTKWKIYISNQ